MPAKKTKPSPSPTLNSRKISASKSQKKVLAKAPNNRPPVVTFMGHVDHGKTTLLDVIRQSNQVQKEHGGITQHLGAYQIETQGRKITFLDTPGHAAFSKMRAQGAQVTDLVVLVVAADDGVKPQTREALTHIRKSQVPFLVALNKIDLPEANPERVKGQLAEQGVIVESYGGDIVTVEVSAKTKKNVDQLLEMILLLSDLQDIYADPQGKLEAVIIETHQDKSKGISATVIVQNGTLGVGSEYPLNDKKLKIRAINDEYGKKIQTAGPGTPVEVFGFAQLPTIGQIIGRQDQPKTMKEIEVVQIPPQSLIEKEAKEESADNSLSQEEKPEKQTIKIVLKADVAGTLEAITSNVTEEVEIISRGVGEVTESDVLLAQVTRATVYAFNTKVSTSALKLAEIEKVTIKTYNIIYKLFEDLEKQVLKILEPTIDEEVLGEAQITAEFKIQEERIAGCKIIKGEIKRNLPLHLQRNGQIIKETNLKTLKRGKEDIDSAKSGNECGISFKPKIDFKINDVIISYRKITED